MLGYCKEAVLFCMFPKSYHSLSALSAHRQRFVTSLFPALAVSANKTWGRFRHIMAHCDFVSLIDLGLVHKAIWPKIDKSFWWKEASRGDSERQGAYIGLYMARAANHADKVLYTPLRV